MPVIDKEICTGCGLCIPYCPLEAISLREDVALIDGGACVECYVCIRNEVCPIDAIKKTPLHSYIKKFQHIISDPTETTEETGVPGRGTEEAKTNDVTGRFKKGEVGICIDMGRPGVGCYLRDVEKVAMAVAKAGLELEGPKATPLATLMTDLATGKLQDEVLDTRVLSVIIEGKCKLEGLPPILEALKKVEKEIDTVFCLGLAVRVDEEGNTPLLDLLNELGIPQPIRGKVNVGLGRPLVED